ncbi:MAG: helix-turn-helix domain-containing protein [Gemmataceae bacterium]
MTDDTGELGAMTCKEFCDRYRIGMTTLYEEFKAHRLRAVKVGRRTLILKRDALAWEQSLAGARAQAA